MELPARDEKEDAIEDLESLINGLPGLGQEHDGIGEPAPPEHGHSNIGHTVWFENPGKFGHSRAQW